MVEGGGWMIDGGWLRVDDGAVRDVNVLTIIECRKCSNLRSKNTKRL